MERRMDGKDDVDSGQTAAPAGETPRRRPNANYRLSKETADGEQLTFYYDRQRRLAKAPQVVKDLYKEIPPRRFGLFRSLVESKPRAMMFVSIVTMCAAILMLSLLGYFGDTYELEGNRISARAVKYEGGASVVTLRKTVKKGWEGIFDDAYAGAVDIAVSPAVQSEEMGEAFPVFYHRVFFSRESAEEYRFSVPFDSAELLVVLRSEKKTLNIKLRNEGKPQGSAD
jgi:hypothetical protein